MKEKFSYRMCEVDVESKQKPLQTLIFLRHDQRINPKENPRYDK